jgi:hypothetical protein
MVWECGMDIFILGVHYVVPKLGGAEIYS